MATCKECGALLPMDYFTLELCRLCIDKQTEVEYDTSTDLSLYTFLEDCDD